MIPIVLTATIIPNGVDTRDWSWSVRRRQYLDAIAFYRKFSKVYFIDNSSYDLEGDSEFRADADCTVLRYPLSDRPARGKGYQEFQMLDRFVEDCLRESSFVKITGRYIHTNFERLFSFVTEHDPHYDMIIDSFVRRRQAITSLFYMRKEAYARYCKGCYVRMNDVENAWAEHVMYEVLRSVASYTFFPRTPIFRFGCSDTPQNPASVKRWLKDMQRELLSFTKAKQLVR